MRDNRVDSRQSSRCLVRYLATAVVGIVGVISLQDAALAQTAYPMVCRGGGNMTMNLSAGPVAVPDYSANRVYNIIRLGFERATQPYDFNNPGSLQPGHCTWRDRPLYGSEPTTINFYTEVPIFVEYKARGRHPLHIRTSSFRADPQTMQTRHFLRLMSTTEIFTIMAWNKAGYYFRVEDIRSGD